MKFLKNTFDYKYTNQLQINMKEGKIIHKDLSYKIIGVLFEVYNELGYGYKEKYYEKAICKYFEEKKLNILIKYPIKYLLKVK